MDTTQKERDDARRQAAPADAAGRSAKPGRKPAARTAKRPAARPAAKAGGTARSASRAGAAVKNRRRQEPSDLSGQKKRAYGNSKPKKPTMLDMAGAAMRTAKAKRMERAEKKLQKNPGRARGGQNAPVIIYTEPKAFNRRKLLMQMITVACVVAALVMGLSVFFKVKEITVTGANVYTPWTVREASNIKEGDNLLTFSRPRAGAQIKANLPYVKNVRFGIKLPDTVNIIIEEEDVVYAMKDTTGTWWLVSSKGRVVEQARSGVASNYTKIMGITLENPSPNTQAVAMEETPLGTDELGAALPVLTTNAQRLNVALQILRALEDNDIVGAAASVDVSHLEDIILWYGTRYQVNLGDASDPAHNLDYKIACMNDVILQLSEYQSGILDVSFTIWPNQVGYSPFG